jgi:hypothetical protein
MRTRRGRAGLLGILVLALSLGACGGDDDSGDGNGAAAEGSGNGAAAVASISEENLPEGFEKTPTIELDGKEWRFDDVPGHYWKVLDDRGFAVGLHFQSDKPFKWAEDVPKGELLYFVYAIPGNCGNGSFERASKAKNASIVGPLPAGFRPGIPWPGRTSRRGSPGSCPCATSDEAAGAGAHARSPRHGRLRG